MSADKQRHRTLVVPPVSWQEITSGLLDEASGVVHATARSIYDLTDVWLFLSEIGFCRSNRALTSDGTAYLHEAVVRHRADAARALLGRALRRSAAARLVCSVLYGCSRAGRTSVLQLLRLHGWRGSWETGDGDGLGSGDLLDFTWKEARCAKAIYHFLHLLNEGGLIAYSKKNDRLRVIWNPDSDETPQGPFFISPQTPYSNVSRLRRLFASLKGRAVWIDRFFDRKGFELIAESVNAERVTHFTILSGTKHCDDRARRDYRRLRQEMAGKGTRLEWRAVNDDECKKIHDRWVLDDTHCWNLPSVNTIFMNQASEVLESAERPDVKGYLAQSQAIADGE